MKGNIAPIYLYAFYVIYVIKKVSYVVSINHLNKRFFAQIDGG
jgi:hypothetical protein